MGEGIVSRKLKAGDTFAVLFVLLVAVLLIFILPKEEKADTVSITTENTVHTYSLFEDRIISLSEKGIQLTVVIENGEVYIKDSTCRDGICKAHGKISKKGCIVCMPAGVVIETDAKGADAVAG